MAPVALRRWLLVVAAAALFSSSPVLSSGRAGARIEVSDTGRFTIRVYAEQVLWRIDDFEITSGIDLRFPEGLVTPYSAFNWYGDRLWFSIEAAGDLEAARGFDAAFKVVVMAGVLW